MTRFILATYSHRHGEDRAAFHDDDGAETYRQSLAAQYWSDIMRGEMPADPAKAADAYFERAGKIGDEFFDTTSMDIEGVPADPVRDAAPDMLAALQELCDLVEDIRAGRHVPDSFTTQPARAAIAKAEGRA